MCRRGYKIQLRSSSLLLCTVWSFNTKQPTQKRNKRKQSWGDKCHNLDYTSLLSTKLCIAVVLQTRRGEIFQQAKPLPLPKCFTCTVFQNILTHSEDDHALWSISTHSLPNPLSIPQGYEGHLILAHCSPSHAACSCKGRTSNPHIYYYGITMPSPSGPQHGGHCLRSIWPWEEAMERGGCQTTILERPLASPHLQCPTWAPADWRLVVGEITELTDTSSQWRTVTPGGGISSQVGGVSVSPQAEHQVVCRQL